LKGTCPRRGQGKIFAGFLTLAPRCGKCGLDFGFADSGDGPAVFVSLIGGFMVLGAALWTELRYEPPFWVHLVIFLHAYCLSRPSAAPQGNTHRLTISQQGGTRTPPK